MSSVFDFDRASDRPLWKQLADELRAQVRDGILRPGDQLPSEARIGEATGLSRTTIREALRRLREEGLVDMRPPKGTFVRSRDDPTGGPGDR